MMPPDYQWMRDQLTTIAKDVAETREDVASIKAGMVDCQRRIGNLETTVYGNGKAGLKTIVERLQLAASSQVAWGLRAAGTVAWCITTGIAIYAALR